MTSNDTNLSPFSCSLDLIQLGTLTLAMGWGSGLNSGLCLHHTERHRKRKTVHDASYTLPHSSELKCNFLQPQGRRRGAESSLCSIKYQAFSAWEEGYLGSSTTGMTQCVTLQSLPARQRFRPRVCMYIFYREKSGYMQKALDVRQQSFWPPSE